MEVKVYGNDINKALRNLKRKMQSEGLIKEMRKREHYEKPSDAKRKKKAEAVRRARKAVRKAAEREGIPLPRGR